MGVADFSEAAGLMRHAAIFLRPALNAGLSGPKSVCNPQAAPVSSSSEPDPPLLVRNHSNGICCSYARGQLAPVPYEYWYTA